MVSSDVAWNIVGIIGNVISFCLFASPIPTFIEIFKKKSVEQFKPDPYLATVMNCMLWVFYGLPFVHPDSTLVLTINSIGLAMELVYLSIYFIFADKKGRLKVFCVLLIECVFEAVVATCTLLLCHTYEERSLIVGILCVVFVVLMYASPLTIMKKVIQTRSVKYMPFSLSLANFLNGGVWVAYALIKFDIFILIGNGIGTLFAVIQLTLYACYFRSTPREEGGNLELRLPAGNRQRRSAVSCPV